MSTTAPSTSRTRPSTIRRAIGLIIAMIMTLTLVAPGPVGAAGAAQSGGLSANPLLGPLSAKWWQWLLSIPSPTNPAATPGADCNVAQSGPVFFLAGAFGPDPVVRECTVPHGKALFFPLINIVSVATAPGETAESLWNDLHVKNAWTITSVSLRVGKLDILKDSRPSALYRGCAGPERGCLPSSFAVTLPKDPIFLEKGRYSPAIADGYYALLPPLPKGEITISFGGAGTWIPDPTTGEVQPLGQDVTYELTVK